jgi:hypothetical protein
MNNKTPNERLLLAAQRGDIVTLNALLDSGVSIESVNEIGDTPLILATRFEKADMVQRLLEAGANTNARNEEGNNALDIASRGYGGRITDLLEQHKQKRKFFTENDCAICIEPLNDGRDVCINQNCGHVFHCNCITGWINGGNRKCPLCPMIFTSIQLSDAQKESLFSGSFAGFGCRNSVAGDIRYLRGLRC